VPVDVAYERAASAQTLFAIEISPYRKRELVDTSGLRAPARNRPYQLISTLGPLVTGWLVPSGPLDTLVLLHTSRMLESPLRLF